MAFHTKSCFTTHCTKTVLKRRSFHTQTRLMPCAKLHMKSTAAIYWRLNHFFSTREYLADSRTHFHDLRPFLLMQIPRSLILTGTSLWKTLRMDAAYGILTNRTARKVSAKRRYFRLTTAGASLFSRIWAKKASVFSPRGGISSFISVFCRISAQIFSPQPSIVTLLPNVRGCATM